MSGSVPNPNLPPEEAESNLKMHPSTPAATTEKSREDATVVMRGTEEEIAPPPLSSQKKKKPKRKRYMPKVIREGKPKPKPKTPKAPKTPANTAEATPAKMKHVRKRKQEGGGGNAKGDPLQPSSHVHAEIVEKAEKVVNLRIVKRLNFDHQESLPTADKHGSGIAKSEATPAKGKHGLEEKQEEEEGDVKRDPLQPPSHVHAEKVAQAEKVVDLNTSRHLNFDPKEPRPATDKNDSGIVESEATSAIRKHVHAKKQEQDEGDAKRDSLQPVHAEKANKAEKVVNLNIVELLNFDPKEPPLTPDKHDSGIVESETFSAEILKTHVRRQTQLQEQLKTYVRRNKMKKEVESHECSTSNSERPWPVKITGEKRQREEDSLWPFEIPKRKRTRRRDKRMVEELSLWPFEILKRKRTQNAKRSSVAEKKEQFPHVEPVETRSPSSCIENPVSGESSSIDVPTSSIEAIDGPPPRTQCMDAMKEPRRCGSSKSTGLRGPLARLECFTATEEPKRHESPKRVLELDGPLARIECLNATEEPRRSEGLNRIVGHDGPLARIECLNATEETTRRERSRRIVGHDKQEKSAPKRRGRLKNKEIVEKIPRRRYTRRRTVPFQEFQHSGDCNDLDAIVRKMMHLSIGDGRELVPYVGGCGAMVPFEDPTGIFTKRKRRVMVDLDPVSIRMWDLLMGSKRSEGDEEEEFEINLKFNQERDALCQRVDLFISCMSRFLGKRSFSPWKGSVVDSVIGVFLTQNVSDFLSSTAFMFLVAAFPAEPKGNHDTANAEISSSPIPSDTNGGSQERMAEQEFSCQKSVVINEVEQMDDKEMTNFNGSPQSNSRSDSVDNLRISSLHFTEKGLAIRSPDCLSDNAVSIDDEDRPLEDVACSPNSAVSTQGSSVTVGQATEDVPSDPVVVSQDSVASSQENSFGVGQSIHSDKSLMPMNSAAHTSQKASVEIGKYKSKSKKAKIDAQNYDWESLRKQICQNGAEKERSSDSMDALNYDALRNAEFEKISNIIKIRGQYISLTSRIKDFLNRLVKDHGNMDLEWLRDAPPDKAKDYLLSIDGLGLKSVECVRLLALRQQAFPVDVNVGRICVRLGWVPLQPLPESVQLHLLDMYPVLATVQKYLWPRICKLDHGTLYELHYLLITFGKVYCTKTKPNCNACPMRGDCKHYASAYASSRLALPPPEDKSLSRYEVPIVLERSHAPVSNMMQLQQPETSIFTQNQTAHQYWEPIIVEPESPEHENMELKEYDIEDFFSDDSEEYSAPFKWEEFTQNLQSYMHENMELEDISKALVTITSEAASFPLPKLKSVERLRTEHQAYVLPDSHPLLRGLAKRERADQGRYLLTIWSPGETVQSTETPQVCCNPQGTGNLCDKTMCFSCNSIREERAQIVRGTLMIPCRTANRGRFPLNGTYFQLQEVFADHHSSYNPIPVPRHLLDNLPMRTVYFGSSLASIAKGLPNERIQKLFEDDYICVRAFDQETRLPKTLCTRLHIGKQPSPKKK